MYNIFLRYYDTVKLVETDEELFNLYNKSNYLGAIEWDKDNLFDEVYDEVDKRIIELARVAFNINSNDDLEIDNFRPIGDDNLFSYSNFLVTNNDSEEPETWGEDLEFGDFKPWNLLCKDISV